MYTTHFPCNECAKIIIQSGIKEVIYLNDKPNKASNILFDMANIKYKKINLLNKSITINI